MWRQLASSEKETKTDRMVAAQSTSQQSTGPAKRLGQKTHVVGSSAKKPIFRGGIRLVSASTHWGCSSVAYDFALGDEDDRISYTLQKPRKSPVRYYTHANHLYSIAATTNTSGSVVERYSYNPYGVRTVKNSAGVTLAKSAVGQDRGFTSYRLDAETGLYFARARMYSAKLGRFISRDQYMQSLMPYMRFQRIIDGPSLYSAFFIPNHTDSSGHYKDPKPQNNYCKIGDKCEVGDGSYNEDKECCEGGKVVKKKTDGLGELCCPSEFISKTSGKWESGAKHIQIIIVESAQWCQNNFDGKCVAMCLSLMGSAYHANKPEKGQITIGPITVNCCAK
jgi:RHS repeat-associated protein